MVTLWAKIIESVFSIYFNFVIACSVQKFLAFTAPAHISFAVETIKLFVLRY